MAVKVIVAGGGMTGLESALRLERKGFEVTLIEPRDRMFFYPLAHRLVKGLSADKATIEYDKKFKGRNIQHIRSKLKDISVDEKIAITDDRKLDYDYLILSYGVDYSGLWASRSVDSTDPEQLESLSNKSHDLRIAVIGGGTTGVEMAAGLNENGFDVDLFGSRPELLPDLSSKASNVAEKNLEKSGVDLFLGNRVREVTDEKEIVTDNESFDVDKVLWAGGHSSRNIMGYNQDVEGLEVDRFQRTSMKDVFAAGDCTSYDGKKDRAVHALVEAKTVSENISRCDKGKDLKERNVKMEPSLIDIGNRKAIFEVSGITVSGFLPFVIEWLGVERRYMIMREYLL